MNKLVQHLALATGLDQSSVRRIMLTAPHRYKVYHIAKKNGGVRRIAQPAREVKVLQRALITLLLENLPVHPSAMAYIAGKSIKTNAYAHRRAGPIVKMDFKDFFPSIKKSDWERYCRDTQCLVDPEDVALSGSLMFHYQKDLGSQRLAIGAPTSPMLSNILMHGFDKEIANRIVGTRIIYTRYADDLTFSAPRTGYLHNVVKIVSQTIKSINYPKLRINDDKTNLVTSKYKRTVTGLVISNEGCITVGWQKKRELHAAVHNAKCGNLNKQQMQILAGRLAFVYSIEPGFIIKLQEKYGMEVFFNIKRFASIKRNEIKAL